jgi:NAD(P)H-hydrate epimerase
VSPGVFPIPAVPLTRAQSRLVDQVAIQEFGFSGLVLMENAASGAARFLQSRYQPQGDGGILIVCGGGNNGGDGLAMARHLYNAGLPVVVWLVADRTRLSPDCQVNWQIVRKTGIPVATCSSTAARVEFAQQLDEAWQKLQTTFARVTWIVDAVLGTGASGQLREPLDVVLKLLQKIPAPHRLALDLPTGWDCDKGPTGPDVFRATITYTFVAPKVSFQHQEAADYLGEVVVGDIGIPPEVLRRLV